MLYLLVDGPKRILRYCSPWHSLMFTEYFNLQLKNKKKKNLSVLFSFLTYAEISTIHINITECTSHFFNNSFRRNTFFEVSPTLFTRLLGKGKKSVGREENAHSS